MICFPLKIHTYIYNDRWISMIGVYVMHTKKGVARIIQLFIKIFDQDFLQNGFNNKFGAGGRLEH